jgi:phospholipase/carboxylesterase
MYYKPPLELTSNSNIKQNNPNRVVDNNIEKIDACVIWLHGLGADGYDFAAIVQQLNLPNVRFILPHAPEIAVTVNNGYSMPAWYDIYGLTAASEEDEIGIKTSQQYVNTLIQREISRGVPSERVILAGFSQGGAIALYTALRYPQKLGAVLALSTYLPLKSKLNHEAHSANASIPIFMAHGGFDDVIKLETAQNSLKVLQNNPSHQIMWREYKMAHSICVEEIMDIQDFLRLVLVE